MSDQQDAADTPLATALASDLRVVLGCLVRRLREQIHPDDLSWTQAAVLRQLGREGPATVTTLARAERVRPQSMGATVAALEAAGLVSGLPDPSDGRQTILSLTEAGHAVILAHRAARQDWLHQAISTQLAPAEQAKLAEAVALLQRLAAS